MRFELSDEQVALRDAARGLLASACPIERVREVADGQAAWDRRLWKQLIEQGWLLLDVPEEDGGLGLGFVEQAVVAEQLGRHVAPVPVVSGWLAAHTLRRLGHEASTAVAAGDTIASVGWGSGPAVDAPLATVHVQVDAGGVRVAQRDAPPEAQPAVDVTRRLAPLELTGAPDSADEALATSLLDRGATLYAAEMLGAAERMLEEATAYAKVREQFGRPIGSFQAVKHRLADALVDVEGMRSAALYAAWAVGTQADDASLAASTAKSWCSDASGRVLDSCLQVFGGIGFTWEHDLHLYLKRAQLDQRLFAAWAGQGSRGGAGRATPRCQRGLTSASSSVRTRPDALTAPALSSSSSDRSKLGAATRSSASMAASVPAS